jgi:hypothetical protein
MCCQHPKRLILTIVNDHTTPIQKNMLCTEHRMLPALWLLAQICSRPELPATGVGYAGASSLRSGGAPGGGTEA